MLFIALCSNSLTTIVRKIMLFKMKILPPLFNIATKNIQLSPFVYYSYKANVCGNYTLEGTYLKGVEKNPVGQMPDEV
jgi:hypothetical protein